MITRNYLSVPFWDNEILDFTDRFFPGTIEKFDDVFELKPEYKKKTLEKDISRLKKQVENLTLILSETKEKLKIKEEELADLNKKT